MPEYKKFNIGELFDIATPKKKFNANAVKFDGGYRYVARGESNNGIRGYITEDVDYLNPANTISFGQDTATMFFQNAPYFTGDKIKIFNLKAAKLTREIAVYLIAAMKKAFTGFSWGRSSFNVNILKAVSIYLPVTSSEEIDFTYMNNYIRESELARINEIGAYLKVTGLTDYTLITNEERFLADYRANGAKYKAFRLGDLFDIFTGRDVIIGRTSDGTIPLISHQHDNNGISKSIVKLIDRKLFNYKETIALADRGVFWASTQNQDFHIGTRVKALVFKDGEKSKEIRLFIATAINKLQVLFKDYLTNATDSLPDLEIQLPADNHGNPNYDFMTTFIRIQQKLIIKSLVDWKGNELR